MKAIILPPALRSHIGQSRRWYNAASGKVLIWKPFSIICGFWNMTVCPKPIRSNYRETLIASLSIWPMETDIFIIYMQTDIYPGISGPG